MSLTDNTEYKTPSGAIYRAETGIAHAFGNTARVLHTAETGTTMEDARYFAGLPEGHEWYMPSGTVVRADFQTRGRGRIAGRSWSAETASNLMCTIIIRASAVPAFTLRVGLAGAEAVDVFLPKGLKAAVKWPNDVLVNGKKICGILCESDGKTICVGTGFNIGQTNYSGELAQKVCSLALIPEARIPNQQEFLEVYLASLKQSLERQDWREALEVRLFNKGVQSVFLNGHPDTGEYLTGTIEGIGTSGELFFRHETGSLMTLVSGEIPL